MTEEHKERGWTTRVGEACVLALFVAVLASVPAALRTARAGGTFPDGLLTGAAVLLPRLGLPSGCLVRRRGLRQLPR